jgi:hypothetical protein
MGCGTLISAALSLAGAGAQEVAASKTSGAMNDVMAQNMTNQKKLQQQGQGIFQQSLSQSTPQAAQQQLAQGQSQLMNAAQQARVPLGLPTSALTTGDQAASNARAQLGQKAMADYGAYGQLSQSQRMKDMNANDQLGLVNNQARFDNSMLAPELQAASQEYSGLAGVGKLLGTAGTLTGLGSSLGLFSSPSLAGFGNASTSAMTGSNMGLFSPSGDLPSLSGAWAQMLQSPTQGSFGNGFQGWPRSSTPGMGSISLQ